MEVIIDSNSGFCWGVVRTIEIAEETLEKYKGNNVYILGQIIHNPNEVKRLEGKGLKTITHSQLKDLGWKKAKVLIRAHGEPPSTYELAKSVGVELIDATCPLVTALQNRVAKFYREGYQIIIFGKREHPEVIGLRGVCNDECIIIKSPDEIDKKVDFQRKTILLSQTTMDKHIFKEIRQKLEEKIKEVYSFEDYKTQLVVKDTLCRAVFGREESLKQFASSVDVVLFVAGKNSSNGQSLFKICKEANPNSFFIEDYNEIDLKWFEASSRIGITGATSTPLWYMEQIRNKILSASNS